MIYRAEKQNFTSTAPLAGFTDANQISSYATMAMAWAISEKLISGYPDQTLRPQNTATRAQFAAIVTRLCAQ